MRGSLTGKVLRANLIIIAAKLVSGAFSVYVLTVNLRTNYDIRHIALPSIEHLKKSKDLMQDVKRLANTWAYMPNRRDQERLLQILNSDFPKLDSALHVDASECTESKEKALFARVADHNKQIIDSVKRITELLHQPVSYVNDSLTDRASGTFRHVAHIIDANDKAHDTVIQAKELKLASLQQTMTWLLHVLYLTVLVTALVIIAVTVISYRYTKAKIIKPILNLNKSIQKMPVGEVMPARGIGKSNEIVEMYGAVNNMISSIIQKVNFAEQIGKGNYEANFELLSHNDKLGIALLSMRDDLKKSHVALTEQGKMLEEAQKLSRTGNYYYNIETGELKTSRTLDDILGIDSSFSKQKVNWRDFILPDFHLRVAEKAVKAIKESTQFSETCLITRYNDGKQCWVHTISEYNYNEKGRAISMFGTIQDVTESKTLEIELNRSYNVAREQNNRLLNFSYIVSHNLRMHTVNIHSLLDLYDEASNEEEKKELLSYMRIASEQLNDTMFHLNEVVAMQQSMSLKLEPINLHAAIDQTINSLMANITDKNAIVRNEVGEDVVVSYNAVYMGSILLNFLSNAIKYSHPARQALVVFKCYKDSGRRQWVLEISDNGLGIDLVANKEKLFGMYKTFHGNHDAKGIGLFMTKYQVEAMGGIIEVDSNVGIGTTFKVYIK